MVTWKGLTSWLTFVMSNFELVTFPLLYWVRCGTWLYRFLIFALILTLARILTEFTRKKVYSLETMENRSSEMNTWWRLWLQTGVHANVSCSRLKSNQIKIENSLAEINFRWPSSNMNFQTKLNTILKISGRQGDTGKLNNSSNHTSEQFGRIDH